MRHVLFILGSFGVLALFATGQNSTGREDSKAAARLAKWKRVEMPFQSTNLTTREQRMVQKLAEACQLLDDVFWRQSDLGGLVLYKSTRDPVLRNLLYITGSRSI